MKRSLKGVLVGLALLAPAAAFAHTDVYLGIGGGYVAPPPPVYYAPPPPPVYYTPAPTYYGPPGPYVYGEGDWDEEHEHHWYPYEWRQPRWHDREDDDD